MKYSTGNKKLILNYIKKMNDSFSSKELYEVITNNNEKVGLTTIYRFLDELEKNDEIVKNYDDKNVAKYRYLEHCEKGNHFYLKCNNCGTLIHVDCNCITELHEHVLKHHKFETDNKNIIISGICKNCLKGKSI